MVMLFVSRIFFSAPSGVWALTSAGATRNAIAAAAKRIIPGSPSRTGGVDGDSWEPGCSSARLPRQDLRLGARDDLDPERAASGDMHVALRERDADASFGKRLFGHEAQVARDLPAVGTPAVVDPVLEHEDEPVGPEVLEDHARRGLLQDLAVPVGLREERVQDLAGIRAVRDADLDPSSHLARGVGPVGDVALDQRRVRYQRLDAVAGADRRRADADVGHGPEDVADLDEVADLQRA